MDEMGVLRMYVSSASVIVFKLGVDDEDEPLWFFPEPEPPPGCGLDAGIGAAWRGGAGV